MRKVSVVIVALAFVAGCANTGEITKDMNTMLVKLAADTAAATKSINDAKDAKAVVAGIEKLQQAVGGEFKGFMDRHGSKLGTDGQVKQVQDGTREATETFQKASTDFSAAVGGKMGEFAEDSKIISDALSKYAESLQSFGK